jgi:hypothetical protein
VVELKGLHLSLLLLELLRELRCCSSDHVEELEEIGPTLLRTDGLGEEVSHQQRTW